MSLTNWAIVYIVDIVFWLWIFLLGGADLLGDSLISGIFIFMVSLKWRVLSAEGIKLFGVMVILFHTILFIVGLTIPEFRSLFG